MGIVLQIINTCIVQAASWFVELLDHSGMTSFYLSMIFLSLLGKFILRPIFGSGSGSDQVRKKSNRSGGDDNG